MSDPQTHEPGCCADRRWKDEHPDHPDAPKVKACTEQTCMRLPAGQTCGDCYAFSHCEALYGIKASNTVCDFFPRRFGLPVTPAIDEADLQELA